MLEIKTKFIIGVYILFGVSLFLIFYLIPEKPAYKQVYNFDKVYFIDANNGWLLDSSGRLFYIKNGGKKWNECKNLPIVRNQYKKILNDIYFIDNQKGWIVGNTIILNTKDGGTTWNTITPPQKSSDWLRINFINNNKGWLLGYSNTFDPAAGLDQGGHLFYTEDGGQNWSLKLSADIIMNFYFLNSSIGWAWSNINGLGNSGIYKTIDGGNTWENIFSTKKNTMYGDDQTDIYFVNETIGWKIRNEGGYNIKENGKKEIHIPSVFAIFKSNDGGKTWVLNKEFKEADFGNLRLTKICFSNPTHGWIVGRIGGGKIGRKYIAPRAVILYTEDGGSTWSFKEFKEGFMIVDAFVINPVTVVFVGSVGFISKYENGKYEIVEFQK